MIQERDDTISGLETSLNAAMQQVRNMYEVNSWMLYISVEKDNLYSSLHTINCYENDYCHVIHNLLEKEYL